MKIEVIKVIEIILLPTNLILLRTNQICSANKI